MLLQEKYHLIRTGCDGHVTDMKTTLTQIVSFALMPCMHIMLDWLPQSICHDYKLRVSSALTVWRVLQY